MRTLFVCAENKIDDHLNEEYSDILIVTDQPTTADIDKWADRIRNRIRALWMVQIETKEIDPKVVCYLDAPLPYSSILNNLKDVMKQAENIIIELPYMDDLMIT